MDASCRVTQRPRQTLGTQNDRLMRHQLDEEDRDAEEEDRERDPLHVVPGAPEHPGERVTGQPGARSVLRAVK
jgi:hypothetical protein